MNVDPVVSSCQEVLGKVQAAFDRSAFQDRGPVELVCVSKKQAASKMQALIDSDLFSPVLPCFGENFVQEWQEKAPALQGLFTVHCIGGLQSNKIRKAVPLFNVIQTVDSLKIAQLLNSEAKRYGKEMPVYLQVNISDDSGKRGFQPDELNNTFFDTLHGLEYLTLQGLMTITRFYERTEAVRPDFVRMRILRDRIEANGTFKKPLRLSMGMSADFEIAIEEGANLVRVGSAIFGERNHPAADKIA